VWRALLPDLCSASAWPYDLFPWSVTRC